VQEQRLELLQIGVGPNRDDLAAHNLGQAPRAQAMIAPRLQVDPRSAKCQVKQEWP
jgi:hypothetical protein